MMMDHTAARTPSSASSEEAYSALLALLREVATLGSSVSLLSWDQETMMPARGAELRAEQLSLLSGHLHRARTDPRIGEWLDASEAGLGGVADAETTANLREIRRDYERAVRLPESLVCEMAQTSSRAMEAWKDARARSDYGSFAPWLEKVVQLNRSKAECLGATTPVEMYDALLDEYEPGARSSEIEVAFAALREDLVPLIGAIADASRRPSRVTRGITIPVAQQEELNRRVATALGFDAAAGRLDTSTHPFCSSIGPGDTRMTTRYDEDDFAESLSSTMHEAGHALYEQGLPKDRFWGQPLAEAASLAIHESQSRLWENQVGRSRAFWEWALPVARSVFGTAAHSLTAEGVYGGVNIVEPGLIRVESDEATYNLHIMLRFDLERALLSGDLPVRDLPGAWNERVLADLGIQVPDDRRGCLQDVHWSMGAIGYFPTYSLGNLYAAQLWDAASAELGHLDERIREGSFQPLLSWLRTNVHQHGHRFSARDLAERVTGQKPSHQPLIRYLRGKLEPLYGL
jgi:carboxypeptidase Taq